MEELNECEGVGGGEDDPLCKTVSKEVDKLVRIKQEEEDNAFVGMEGMGVKVHVKLEESDSPLEYSREDSPMSEERNKDKYDSNCLVCLGQIPQSRTSISEEDCKTLFKYILGYPKKPTQDYIRRFGLLQDWIPLCSQCLEEVREWKEIKTLIKELKEKSREHQKSVVKKIKTSYAQQMLHRKLSGELIENPQRNCRGIPDRSRAIAKVRGHVFTKSYKDKEETVNESSSDDEPSPTSQGKRKKLKENKSKKPEPQRADPANRLVQPVMNNGVFTLIYFCELCENATEGFSNELMLIAHQKTAHSPSPAGEAQKLRIKSKSVPPPQSETGNDQYGDHQDVAEETEEGGSTEDKVKRSRNKKPVKPASTMLHYSCPHCPKVKDFLVNRYAQHLAIHQKKPFRCEECLELLPDDEDMHVQHWNSKHEDKGFYQPERIKHLELNPGPIWTCGGCLKSFKTESERDEHSLNCKHFQRKAKKRRFRPFTCVCCTKRFHIHDEWRFHRLLEHPELDSLSCSYCDENFGAPVQSAISTSSPGSNEEIIARDDLKFWEHLKSVHERHENFNDAKHHDECQICGFVFVGSSLAKKKHVEKEHGINGRTAFPCRFCGVVMCNARTLRIHESKYHFLKEKCVCDICGEPFITLNPLLHHKFIEHKIIPEGGKVINCPHEGCGYQNVVEKYAKSHYNRTHLHANTLPYKCKYCEKGFKNTSQLRRHQIAHENKYTKPFQCEICGSGFAEKNYLYIHKRLSHEKRKFPCALRKKNRSKSVSAKKLKVELVSESEHS